MGLLTLSSRPKTWGLTQLPSGCFTVDRNGRMLSSTLPQSFPLAETNRIADIVIAAFRSAAQANLVFSELQIQYATLKLTARELKGGAIVFLVAKTRS